MTVPLWFVVTTAVCALVVGFVFGWAMCSIEFREMERTEDK
jgi:hypothetical protein